MLTGSWRTTLVGVLAGLALLIGQATALLDTDPATVVDMERVLEGLALVGLGYFSRDNKVSSESVGAR